MSALVLVIIMILSKKSMKKEIEQTCCHFVISARNNHKLQYVVKMPHSELQGTTLNYIHDGNASPCY